MTTLAKDFSATRFADVSDPPFLPPLDPPAKCPCCGHDVAPGAVAVDLGSNTLAVGWSNQRVRLQPQEAEIVYALVSVWPQAKTRDQLISALWGGSPPNWPVTGLQVRIASIRSKITPLGLAIVNSHNRGWRIEIPNIVTSQAA